MEELRKQWITSEKEYREGEVFVYRQKFTASQVKKAVFYGTALGVYEAELNGTKIGSQMFAPGFSYYPRRVLYQTHEVTELLREGENTLTVYLGQGWYCGRFSLRKSDTDIRRAAGGCMDSGTGGCGRKPKDCLRRDGGGTGIPV